MGNSSCGNKVSIFTMNCAKDQVAQLPDAERKIGDRCQVVAQPDLHGISNSIFDALLCLFLLQKARQY
jgi:hypothetical protein